MNKLTAINVTDLDVVQNTGDLRRDLHIFVRYVQARDVKRQHRSNDLSKADSLRLAKMMSDPDAPNDVKEMGNSKWVDSIDDLALKLGFVNYDTKGTYAGYTSYAPSFPDNYIQPDSDKHQSFLESPPADQERLLLSVLLGEKNGDQSEFYRSGVLSRLDRFPRWGSATGVVPTLNFPQIRRFLLDLLQRCEVGVWYSTASLIQYLKASHPFFLIPQNPKDKEGKKTKRYANFHENTETRGNEVDILDSDPDAFERVEGRYVERFLEGAPLTLGYLDVAYSKAPHKGVYPSINMLRAFRVNNRLRLAVKGNIPSPSVTLLPTFEIHVESEFYPAGVLSQLTPLADVVSEDKVTILKLKKEKVAARLTEDENLNVVSLMTQLTRRKLPQNVQRELEGWAQHSEKFVLYRGFALLEGDEDLPAAEQFTVERIAPRVRIVHSPDKLFAELEKAELAPLKIKHSGSAPRRLPLIARTVFPKQRLKGESKRKAKQKVTLRRQTTITLHVPNGKLLERLRKALLDARCPVETDKDNLTITFFKKYEQQVNQAIKTLKEDHLIHIEDIE